MFRAAHLPVAPVGGRVNVLVLGSGGREHALAWKISTSKQCESVFLHPGNAGTERAGIPSLGDIASNDVDRLLAAIESKRISLVVIGPENLLHDGIADQLRDAGVRVVGPGKAAAQLETSKVFAKEFMSRAGIPTADFIVVDSAEALERAASQEWPRVLKLDGLAAGKGVVVAKQASDVKEFSDRIWRDREFGPGPHRVVVEEFLPGRELSYMGLCDGKRFLPLSSATDYKRVGDGGTGPNTGGMGAISPSPYFTKELEKKISDRILAPMLAQLKSESLDYFGVLYVGLMINRLGDPFVLEFNARFGDPETQAVLMRLESDFVQLLDATAAGTLDDCPTPLWNPGTAIYVVGAAEHYPAKPATGDLIEGLDRVPSEVKVFFAGVKESGDGIATAGGRVLGLGALGDDAAAARKKAYGALDEVRWRGRHFRTDIGLQEE